MTTFSPADPSPFALVEAPAGGMPIGRIVFVQHGLFLHAMIQRRDVGESSGLAAVFGTRLVMAFGPRDQVEIGAYRIEGGTLEGLWVPPGAKGVDLHVCGRERSRRLADGTWQIEQAHSIDGSGYHGTLTVTPRDAGDAATRPADLIWKLHDGEYRSFGLLLPDAMFSTFCFEPAASHGIAVYETMDHGLRGTLLGSETRRPRSEWLRAGT